MLRPAALRAGSTSTDGETPARPPACPPAHQLNIALTILSIILFNTVISLVGSAAITSFLYSVVFGYILPNDLHRKQRALKGEILKGRTELSNTSAQDDFSKWAKIRRRVDKQGVELEAMSAWLDMSETS